MTTRTPLSPAAQAVLDAWVAAKRTQARTAGCYAPLAAAMRAAALYCNRDSAILLSLADELEGTDA